MLLSSLMHWYFSINNFVFLNFLIKFSKPIYLQLFFAVPSWCAQSPIALDIQSAVKKSDMPPLKYHGYDDKNGIAVIRNTGHSIEITVINATLPKYIDGGPLPANENYTLAQLHFHWGVNDNEGSEHMLNGKQ